MEPAQEEVKSLAAVTARGLGDCRSRRAVSLLPRAGLPPSLDGSRGLRAQPAGHRCPAAPTGAGLSLGALGWSTPRLPSLGNPEASMKA